MSLGRFVARVPASTSNLGPGFDCLGLAVDLYLTLEWDGEGAGTELLGARPPAGFGNLLDRSRDDLGLPDGGALRVRSEIPVGRGLGSSAALRIALAALRTHLRGGEPERGMLLDAVASQEGHPDNAAPALMGGLVAATLEGGRVDAIPLPFSDRIALAFCAPPGPVSTDEARAVLPERIETAVAFRTVNRIARLLPALAAGDGNRIARTLVDEIHVPARLGLIPGGSEVRRAAVDAGAWGCTVSGAGSGLIALGPHDRIDGVLAAMREAFLRETGAAEEEFPAHILRPDLHGARWASGREAGALLSPPRGPSGAPPLRRG